MTVNLDADLRNADWINTLSWDLPTEKDAFLRVVRDLDHFMQTPAAEAMPAKLAAELGVTPPRSLQKMMRRLKIGNGNNQYTQDNATQDEAPSAGTGAGTQADPYVTSDPDDAVRALAEGKYVDLKQPRGESTLIDELAELGREARAAGEKAQAIDLGRVTINGTNIFLGGNLGVERAQMPQFTGTPEPGSPADAYPRDEHGEVDLTQAFKDHLENDLGVTVTNETVPAEVLRATQDELDGVKVAGMSEAIEAGTYVPTERSIWTTTDDYVLDGHHTWGATLAVQHSTGEQTFVRANAIDMPITDALREAQTWTEQMGINPRAVGKSLIARFLGRWG